MKSCFRILSVFLAIILTFTLVLTSCDYANENEETISESGPSNNNIPKDEYTLELVDGYNQITFYWSHSGSYENCDIWIWWGDKAGQGYTFHECQYGAKALIHFLITLEYIYPFDCLLLALQNQLLVLLLLELVLNNK